MWRLRLLGDLALEQDDKTVYRFRARKYGLLLAFLALHPTRAHAREELVALFWPDSDEEAGRVCLRSALASLRRQFRGTENANETDHWPLRDRDRELLQVNPDLLATDVNQFVEAARRALASGVPDAINAALAGYTGPLLPGVYDDWAVAERTRLEEWYERLCDARDRILTTTAPKPKTSLIASFSPSIVAATDLAVAPEKVESQKDHAPRVHLPRPTTHFVGRTAELEHLTAWFADAPNPDSHCLLTITGMAGMGKTRLAVEAARRATPNFAGGVCFVGLAACEEAARIGEFVANALGLSRGPDTDALDMAATNLRQTGRSLLILDNLEQLVEDAGQVVHRLLDACPDLCILATSRRPLQLEGEQELPLAGLTSKDALRLFVDRARTVRPDFAVSLRSQRDLEAVCHHLDGVPLAVELCAAWSGLLVPAQMNAKLQQGQGRELLVSRRRDTPPRHRSVHAALEASRPTEPLQSRFFVDLSVFRGGFTLDAACAVMNQNDALIRLADLRERSLVLAEPAGDDLRFRMLETVRDFAEESLTEMEKNEVRRRHFRFFHDYAERTRTTIHHADTARAFTLLETEDANIRAGLRWALHDGDLSEVDQALGQVRGLLWHWWVRGREYQTALQDWFAPLVARLDEPGLYAGTLRASILRAAAWYDRQHGDSDTAVRRYHEAAALYQNAGDVAGQRAAILCLADLAHDEERFPEAHSLLLSALPFSGNDPTALRDIRNALSQTYFAMGDSLRGRALLEALLCDASKSNPDSAAKLNLALAHHDREAGNLLSAETRARACVAFFRTRQETWNLGDSLYQLGLALIAQNKAEGHTYLAESRDLFTVFGDQIRVADINARLKTFIT